MDLRTVKNFASRLWGFVGRSKAAPVDVDRAKEIVEGFRLQFRRRLEAGVDVTLEEWSEWDHDDAGTLLQNLWLEERQTYLNEQAALQAQFIASAVRGNVLNEEAVFERLSDDKQDAIVRERAKVASMIKQAHARPWNEQGAA